MTKTKKKRTSWSAFKTKKPTRRQYLAMAEDYWIRYGRLTIHPNKASYMAYAKGMYDEVIKKMTNARYVDWVKKCQQTQIETLKRVEAGIVAKREEIGVTKSQSS